MDVVEPFCRDEVDVCSLGAADDKEVEVEACNVSRLLANDM